MNAPTTVTSLATYRNETPYPFCPGCGHHSILDQLSAALNELRIDPNKVVLVSDIGCSGLSDQYFVTSAFHGLHGRSITYATGIKLVRPDLKVIVSSATLEVERFAAFFGGVASRSWDRLDPKDPALARMFGIGNNVRSKVTVDGSTDS